MAIFLSRTTAKVVFLKRIVSDYTKEWLRERVITRLPYGTRPVHIAAVWSEDWAWGPWVRIGGLPLYMFWVAMEHLVTGLPVGIGVELVKLIIFLVLLSFFKWIVDNLCFLNFESANSCCCSWIPAWFYINRNKLNYGSGYHHNLEIFRNMWAAQGKYIFSSWLLPA